MNNKGFTLTELIIVVAIMGLIAVIAFPAIVDLQKQQKDAKYYAYEDAAIETAKLYTDQVKDDIGGKEGCFTITKDQLVATGLLDEFEDSSTTECDFEIQYIIATDGKEDYKIKMWCKTTDLEEYPDGILYDNRDKVTFEDPATCQPTVPDGDYCRYTEKNYTSDFSSCTNASGDADCGGGVQTRSYTLVSIYDENINCANDVEFTETRSCNTHACLNADGLTATGDSYTGSLDVNLSFDHVNGREMLITVNNSTTPDIDDPRWETINTEKEIILNNYGISTLAGQQINIYVFVKDVYGNIFPLSTTYTLHKDCLTSNLVETDRTIYGLCTKTTTSTAKVICGGGTQTYTVSQKDKISNNTCPTKQVEVGCSSQACANVTISSITGNSFTGSRDVTVKGTATSGSTGEQVCVSTSSTSCSTWHTVPSNGIYSVTYNFSTSYAYNGSSHNLYVHMKDKVGSTAKAVKSYTLYEECQSHNKEYYNVRETGLCSAACGGGTMPIIQDSKDKYSKKQCDTNASGTKSCNTQTCTTSTCTYCISTIPCLTTSAVAKIACGNTGATGVLAGYVGGAYRYYTYPAFCQETGEPYIAASGRATLHCTFSTLAAAEENLVVSKAYQYNNHFIQSSMNPVPCNFDTSWQLQNNSLYEFTRPGSCNYSGLTAPFTQNY